MFVQNILKQQTHILKGNESNDEATGAHHKHKYTQYILLETPLRNNSLEREGHRGRVVRTLSAEQVDGGGEVLVGAAAAVGGAREAKQIAGNVCT